MREAYLYNWHSIDLDVTEIAHGRFRWTYFIDRNYCSQDTSDLPVADVRAHALLCAHTSIDMLDAITANASRLDRAGPASRPRLANRTRDLAASAETPTDRPER